jgi:hypothetical protein
MLFQQVEKKIIKLRHYANKKEDKRGKKKKKETMRKGIDDLKFREG